MIATIHDHHFVEVLNKKILDIEEVEKEKRSTVMMWSENMSWGRTEGHVSDEMSIIAYPPKHLDESWINAVKVLNHDNVLFIRFIEVYRASHSTTTDDEKLIYLLIIWSVIGGNHYVVKSICMCFVNYRLYVTWNIFVFISLKKTCTSVKTKQSGW